MFQKIKNLKKVSSYEEMAARIKQTPKYLYEADKLYSTYSESVSDSLIVPPGYVQYGPYYTINAGCYTVKVIGSGLDLLSKGAVYINTNNQEVKAEIGNEEYEKEYISYQLKLNGVTDRNEFCTYNNGTEDIRINRIEVYSNDIVVPEILKSWW